MAYTLSSKPSDGRPQKHVGKRSAIHRNDTVKQKRISKEEEKHQGLDHKKKKNTLCIKYWTPSSY